MQRLTPYACLLLIACAACRRNAEGPVDRAVVDDTLAARHDVVAGDKGEPPTELHEFPPPITLLAAGEYLDGGTTWVSLRDADGYRLTLCVNQNDNPGKVPGHALLLGGTSASQESARLPLNHHEASLVVRSLENAIERAAADSPAAPAVAGDAAESQIASRLTTPLDQQQSAAEWDLAYARQALRMLKTLPSLPLADSGEVAARRKRLAAVDLEATATEFRSRSGTDRSAIWKQLEPVLQGSLRGQHTKAEVSAQLNRLLGKPDPAALDEFSVMISHNPIGDTTPIDGDVFAYVLNRGDSSLEALLVDFRHPSQVSFAVLFGQARDAEGVAKHFMDDLASTIDAAPEPRSRASRLVFDSPLRIVIALALIVGSFYAADLLRDLFPAAAREPAYPILLVFCGTPFYIFGCYALRFWPVWRCVLHMWLFGAVLALAEWCLNFCGIVLPGPRLIWLVFGGLTASMAARLLSIGSELFLRRYTRLRLP